MSWLWHNNFQPFGPLPANNPESAPVKISHYIYSINRVFLSFSREGYLLLNQQDGVRIPSYAGAFAIYKRAASDPEKEYTVTGYDSANVVDAVVYTDSVSDSDMLDRILTPNYTAVLLRNFRYSCVTMTVKKHVIHETCVII